MADKLRLELLFNAVDKASSKLGFIGKNSRKMAGDFAAARKELQSLNKTQGAVNEFRKLKRETSETAAQFKNATKRVASLASGMKNAEKPTKAMERALAAAKREAGALKDKLSAEDQQLQRLRDRLKAAGILTKDLANGQRDLARRVGEASKKMEDQKGKLGEAGGKGSVGKTGGSFVDTAAKGGVIAGTVKEVADAAAATAVADASLEDIMVSIAIKADLSRKKTHAIAVEMKALSSQTRLTPTEMAKGLDALLSAGLSLEDSRKMIGKLGKSSHTYQTEIAQDAKTAVAAVQNLGIEAGRTGHTLDMMAFAGKAGKFEVEDLARSMPAFSGTYQIMGRKGEGAFAQLAAGAEIVMQTAGNAENAATNFGNLLQAMNQQDVLARYAKQGVDLHAALKKAKDPLEELANITLKLTHGDSDKIAALMPDRQAFMALGTLMPRIEEYKRLRDATANANGTVDADFAKRAETTMSKWEAFKAGWENFKIDIGSSLKGITNGMLDGMNSIFGSGQMAASMDQGVKVAALKGGETGTAYNAQLTQALVKAYTDTSNQGRMIGMGIGDGVMAGLAAKDPQIKARIAQLGTGMQGQMKSDLKIHSPSRVFRDLASEIPAGIAAGIDRKSHLPMRSLAGLHSSLTGAAPGARQGGGQKQGASGSSIHYAVTINLGGAGSAQKDAVAIKRELDHLLAVDARTSYADA